jgi:hypothetical protein
MSLFINSNRLALRTLLIPFAAPTPTAAEEVVDGAVMMVPENLMGRVDEVK